MLTQGGATAYIRELSIGAVSGSCKLVLEALPGPYSKLGPGPDPEPAHELRHHVVGVSELVLAASFVNDWRAGPTPR